MVLAVFAVLIVLFVVLPLVGVALWFVISTALVGLVLGALGRLIVPGEQPIGVLATIICGWAGSLIGGVIGRIVWSSLTSLGDVAHRGRHLRGRRFGVVASRPQDDPG